MDSVIFLRVVLAITLGTSAVKTQGPQLCANIVFAFDTSCSISEETKRVAVNFMDDFVSLFGSIADPRGSTNRFTQFALISFDLDPRKVFGFGEAPSKDDVINKIQEGFSYSSVDCKTVTHRAIDMANNFFESAGEQNDGSPNVFILITDARTQPQKYINDTKASIDRLRRKNNTYAFLVQVPNNNGKTDDVDTIEQVAFLAEPENPFQYSGDSKQLAESVFNRLADMPSMTCPGEETSCDDAPVDILLILDHSNSIKPENIILVREAMSALVNRFRNVGDGDSTVKFALLTYNNDVKKELLFNETGSGSRDGTLKAINEESMSRRKNTRTDLALEYANNIVFTPNAGDRPFAHNAIILATDGRTMKKKFQKNTFKAANALKARTGRDEVSIFLLGLPGRTRAKNQKQREKEWNEIPSEPKDTHFQEFGEFEQLLPFIEELSRRVCAAGIGV